MTKAALITGGSSGIGLAIARMLKEEGYELTLASRTRAKVEAAAGELGAVAIAADVGREEDCSRLVAAHAERFGRLDVLVNGFLRRLPGTHRYELTADGRRLAVFFAKTYARVVTPSLAELDPALPDEIASASPLARSWRGFERALEARIADAALAA